jgi:hypothetical protein
LKKITSINSNLDFHKEKEMVDFRKWLLALAFVGLLLGVSSSAAYAQGNSFTCAVTAVPNIVRAEGIAELLGDLILNCSGGTPTVAGLPIPLQNVVITVGGTNVTSRIEGSTVPGTSTYLVSEALLLIDEPFPAAPNPANGAPDVTNPATTQLGCIANNNTNCAITSLGVGLGAAGSYSGAAGHYNIFQGTQQGLNSISWSGVPIDAPGTAGTRVVRITNIRANASALAVGSTLIPTTISESIFVNGTQIIAINQGPNGSVVGNVTPGLVQSIGLPGFYTQCNSVNTYLLGPPNDIVTDSGITVSATEGFRYSFKAQNFAQVQSVWGTAGGSLGANGVYLAPGTPLLQDVLNYPYSTESGFSPDAGASLVSPSAADYPGQADQGTQITFTVAGVGTGVTLYAPSYVYLQGAYGTGTAVGVAVLTSGGTIPPVLLAGGTPTPAAQVALTASGTTVSVTYEIYYSDPSVLETLALPISVEYVSNTSSNIPAVTTSPATAVAGFSPQSSVITASPAGTPIPRFIPSPLSPASFYSIVSCSCNLLFPFVSNIAGFDTGIAIANTTADPFGTLGQTGTVTLNYYGNIVEPTTPSSPVPPGEELIFTLSSGGNFGVQSTPGFQGYIIAQANFQFCHGFAFISTVSNSEAEGYLAIQLDIPGLERTFQLGENKGN